MASPPLDTLLGAIPSLPRPILDRLVERAIDYMDEIDGDADLEDDDPPEDTNDAEIVIWSTYGT